jgi:hypothetical protein
MAIVGKVPGKGLTPEAAEALNQQTNDLTDTVSEVEEDNPFDAPIGEPLFAEYAETGDTVEDSRLRQKPQEPPPARDAKPGIPSLDEWMDFFSRIVIRVACDWYIEWAFRGIDENRLTDREIHRVQLTDEERQRNRIARKYKNPTIVGRAVPNERTGQDQPPEGGNGYAGANGGRIVDGVTIINPGG